MALTLRKKTDQALSDIVTNIQQISDLNTQVATATEEQSVVINEINTQVNSISDSSENGANSAVNIATSSKSLSSMAKDLDGMVQSFTLENELRRDSPPLIYQRIKSQNSKLK